MNKSVFYVLDIFYFHIEIRTNDSKCTVLPMDHQEHWNELWSTTQILTGQQNNAQIRKISCLNNDYIIEDEEEMSMNSEEENHCLTNESEEVPLKYRLKV